ncbi:unnamed protein product [Urochloa humidicola]
MGFFQSLWVLDVRNMDWELDLSQDIIGQMAVNMREIHVKKGRIWRNNLAWRELRNLHKLRVLELLDLSGNNTIQVLPSLCAATGLKTLILNGCAELDHVGPGLPPSLESFSFNAGARGDGNNTAKISRITLAGCAKLVDLRLLGSLSNLEELDLSGTPVKILNLQKEIQVENLRRIFLIGCKQLCSIVWPENGMQQLRLLFIDTRPEVELFRETSRDSLVHQEQERSCHAHVWITDIRFLQSLGPTSDGEFRWITSPFKLNLYLSCTNKKEDGKIHNKVNSSGQVVGSPSLHASLISLTCRAYDDVSIEQIATELNDSSALQFVPQDIHIEIGQGKVNTNVVTAQGIQALCFVMNTVQSLYLHDNSSITHVIPEQAMLRRHENNYYYCDLKWCRVERSPALETVFVITDYADGWSFEDLKTFSAAGLLMARSIWSRGRPYDGADYRSFAKLRAIHLHMCPRLQFVLPMFWGYSTLSSLETLHIVCCRDLKQIFPVNADFLKRIATRHQNGMLEFPKLKHLYLHDLSCLQQICEAKMFAPKLETVRLRGCWGLRRLPATDPRRRGGQLVDVNCEKDWWDNLEWDGLHVGHDPSLFAPRHSAYYKKRILRTTVLR